MWSSDICNLVRLLSQAATLSGESSAIHLIVFQIAFLQIQSVKEGSQNINNAVYYGSLLHRKREIIKKYGSVEILDG